MKNIKKVLFAGALALGAQVNAQTNESSSVGIQTQDVVSSTKQKVDAVNTSNVVTSDEAGKAFIEVGAQDSLQYAINFATNPNSSFDLGNEASYSSSELTKMKKVPGVKVSKGKVEYSPSKTLENLKTKKAVYASDMEKMFAGNTYLLKHFQFFLNSKLGVSQKEFSGKFDAETITKLSSVLKNESIFSSFDRVLMTYGSQGFNVFNLNGKTVVVYTDLQDFSDKDAIAILDMPYFDENGEVQFVNGFNKEVSLVGLESLKNFAFVPGLDDNQMRSVLKNWSQAVHSQLGTIKYTKVAPEDLKAKEHKKPLQNDPSFDEKLLKDKKQNQNGPTILAGNGQVLSGHVATNSGMGIILKRNTLGFSHQDEIALDKVNVKATLEFIAEATNMGDNSRVAAKLIMLYSMARVGTTLYMEKGDLTTKAGVGVSYKTDAGDVIKLDYGFYKQFLEYTFPEVNTKRKLAPEQHGLSLSYTQKDIEKFELLKEMTYSIRAFKVESLDVGEVGKITTDVNNIFNQWKAMGALQGGKKVEAEVNFAFDLSKYVADELSMTNFRLDVAPRLGVTKTDDVLDIKGKTTIGGGLKTRLTALFFDDTLKASLFSDVYTGGIYSVGLEISKKLSAGEATFYVKQDSYGPNVKSMTSIGVKGVINNPFNLQDDENREVSKFAPLFNQNPNISKFLTYEEAELDQKLFAGYAIAPKPVIQKIHEIRIDRGVLPAGSTLDKNYDGSLKQVNLATGVNNLNGTISVNPSAFISHFSVTGNSFITVKNLEKMDAPATYNIVAGQSTGTSVIMLLILTKGSVMIDQTVDFLADVPANLAQDFYNKTKTIDEIRAILAGSVLPTSSFGSGSVTKLTSDGSFTNTYTTNSPGVITYSSSNTAVATVDSSTGAVTIVGAGTASITANQAAATGFTADSDTYTLTVNAAPAPDAPTVNSENISTFKVGSGDFSGGISTSQFSITFQHAQHVYIEAIQFGTNVGQVLELLPGVPNTLNGNVTTATPDGPLVMQFRSVDASTGQTSGWITYTGYKDTVNGASDSTISSMVVGDSTGSSYINESINTTEPVKVISGSSDPQLTVQTTSLYATTIPVKAAASVAGPVNVNIWVEDEYGNQKEIKITRVIGNPV